MICICIFSSYSSNILIIFQLLENLSLLKLIYVIIFSLTISFLMLEVKINLFKSRLELVRKFSKAKLYVY